MLVYRDLMSSLAKDLFFISMLILLRSEPELLICTSVIVPNNRDNVLAKNYAMLLGADPIPEINSLKGILDLWVETNYLWYRICPQ